VLFEFLVGLEADHIPVLGNQLVNLVDEELWGEFVFSLAPIEGVLLEFYILFRPFFSAFFL